MSDVLSEMFAEPEAITPEVVDLAPIEPIVEQVPVPVVETPPAPERQAGMIPIEAYFAEREKRQAAEARIQVQEAPKVAVPDPYDDPEGYHAYTQSSQQQALMAQRFDMSAVIAKQTHGADAVDAAAVWAEEKAKSDPSFATMYMRESHPIEWIVQQHKRDGLYSQIPQDISSLDELIEREIAKRGLTAPIAPVGVQPALKPATPPRSIASDSSATISQSPIIDPDASFNAIFNRR